MKMNSVPIMNRTPAKVVSVISGLTLVLFVNHLWYYISPFFAWLHQLALLLATLMALFGIPIVLYQYLTDQLDESWKVILFATFIWAVLAVSEPDVDKVEAWTVTCLIGERFDPTEMAETTRHCYEDALVAARDYYEKKDFWLREYREAQDEWPLEEPEIDIRIDVFSYTPALDWFNELFGTRLGIKSYALSLRYMEHGEDPFGIIARQEFEYELGREREDYFRP